MSDGDRIHIRLSPSHDASTLASVIEAVAREVRV
jgi:hypothetical protein